MRHFTKASTAGVKDTSVAERAGEISAAQQEYAAAAESFAVVAKDVFATISEDLPALSEKEQLS